MSACIPAPRSSRCICTPTIRYWHNLFNPSWPAASLKVESDMARFMKVQRSAIAFPFKDNPSPPRQCPIVLCREPICYPDAYQTACRKYSKKSKSPSKLRIRDPAEPRNPLKLSTLTRDSSGFLYRQRTNLNSGTRHKKVLIGIVWQSV